MAKAILLADITGPMGPVGDWYKGVIPNGSNFNDYTGTSKTGLYSVLGQSDAATMSNIPENYAGSLLVLPVGAGASQEYTSYYWPARKWIRNSAPSTGTGWTAWRSIRGDAYVKHDQIAAGTDLNDIYGEGMEGSHASWITSITATLKNLPPALEKDPRSFILFAKTVGNGTVQEIDTYYWPARKFIRNSAPSIGTGWTAWKQVLMEGDITSDGGSGGANGIKTLPLILTAGRGGNEAKAPTSATVEYDAALSDKIDVRRYRFALRDGNPRFGTSTAQRIALSNISFGGVSRLSSMSTNADGSITFSPWFTGNFGNLKFDYVAPQAPRYIVGGGRVNGVRRTEMPFELWIEVEVPASTPAIGVVGDSNSVGVNATIPIYDAYMSQYCRDNGIFPVLYGHSGDAWSASGDPDAYKFNRWNHLDKPDMVLNVYGANDLSANDGTNALQDLKDAAIASWAVVNEKISKNQHVGLLKSRSNPPGNHDSNRRSLNTWFKSTPDPIREWHDIASPVTANDTGGLLAQFISSDGTHMNTLGHTTIKNALHKSMVAVSAVIKLDTDGVPYF